MKFYQVPETLLKRILNHLEHATDEGPYHAPCRSDELKDDTNSLRKILDLPEED